MTDTAIIFDGEDDVVQRIEAFIEARFAKMESFEYETRLELAMLDESTAKQFLVHHEGPDVVVDWPAGVELLSIPHAELMQGLA